jgi:hypothetical protein
LGRLDSVDDGHLNVHHDHVRAEPLCLLDRDRAVAGLANHLHAGLGGEDRDVAGPHHALVIADQHPDGFVRHALAAPQ